MALKIAAAMPYQHTNRRGDVYYIQATERKGKIAYSAARKPSGRPLDRVPDGYEIYECPDAAQVFVRKIKPTRILPAEKQLVEDAVRRLAKVEHFIVDVDEKSLVIYLSDALDDFELEIRRGYFPVTADQARAMQARRLRDSNYKKMMRFVLTGEAPRLFSFDRWCFRGSIDDWYSLDFGKPLGDLVKKYVPHLNKQSFFELM